jgi:hypothetical protein
MGARPADVRRGLLPAALCMERTGWPAEVLDGALKVQVIMEATG